MVSAKLLDHLRATEADRRNDDRRGLQSHPKSDPAFKLIQSKQIEGPGNYILSDVLPRGPSPKIQTISRNALDAAQIPYQVQPAIHPHIEGLERQLMGPAAIERIYRRDFTTFNEFSVPYESVLWDQPLPDEADLHFVDTNAIRLKGIPQKLVSTTFLNDYQLVPVLYAIAEPEFGNRLLEPRDSRNY